MNTNLNTTSQMSTYDQMLHDLCRRLWDGLRWESLEVDDFDPQDESKLRQVVTMLLTNQAMFYIKAEDVLTGERRYYALTPDTLDDLKADWSAPDCIADACLVDIGQAFDGDAWMACAGGGWMPLSKWALGSMAVWYAISALAESPFISLVACQYAE